MKFMMKKRFSRRGTIVVLLAVCLMVILAFVAISVDGGLLLDQRRQVQSAADASAMAGACMLYSQFPTNKGLDSGNSAVVAALNQAAANGYYTNGNNGNSNIIVNIPPQSGLYAGQPSYIEVIITYQQPRYFSRIWGSDTIPVTARAVARGAWTQDGIGVLVLDYTGKSALNDQGNG